jgi:hypothetical protein
LKGVPQWLLWPVPPNANSTICVWHDDPELAAEWSVATRGPSCSQGSAGSRRLDPDKHGYPEAANRSFIETGSPCKGPTVTPAAKGASAAIAGRRARA